MNKFAAFAGGLLFGTAGLKILSSRDAKKVYVHTTAAVMAAATSVKEGAEDIYADAKALNEKYAAEDAAAVIEDTSKEAE